MVLGGCAQNAAFEIELELPQAASPGGRAWPAALVRVALDTDGAANDAATFDAWDDGTAASIPEARQFTLSTERCTQGQGRDFPCNARLSIVTTRVDADVIMQIRFCNPGDGSCDASPPELRYHIEHPFYRGQRTFLRTGPLDGMSGTYTYNLHDDFPELCEQPAAIDQATRVIWRCRVEGCFDGTRGQIPSSDYGWCATASGASYAAGDACSPDATAPDAGERVVGAVDNHPPHECDLHASSCAALPGAGRGGSAWALVLAAAVWISRRRARG